MSAVRELVKELTAALKRINELESALESAIVARDDWREIAEMRSKEKESDHA